MSGAVYGGDDVGALVLDFGSFSVKAGCAGEDTPKCIFPSIASYLPSTDKISTTIHGSPQKTSPASKQSAAPMELDDVNHDIKPKSKRDIRGKYSIGDVALGALRSEAELKSPIKDGLVDDWDLFESMLDYMYDSGLKAKSCEHPLLMAEPVWNTRAHREKLMEIFFEKYNIPAFFLSKSAVLTTFASGRSTAVVLDCGESGCSSTPVYDGYALSKPSLRTHIGGKYLMKRTKSILLAEPHDLTPSSLIANKESTVHGVDPQPLYTRNKYRFRGDQNNDSENDHNSLCYLTKSYYDWLVGNVVRDWQCSLSQVSESTFDRDFISKIPTVPYEFPSGSSAQFGVSRFEGPECLFNPTFSQKKTTSTAPTSPRKSIDVTNMENSAIENLGVHQMVYNTINGCDPDIRSALYSNLIISGGTSLISGFGDRLYNELYYMAPPGNKLKIIAPTGTAERRFGAWIGGSILASLGSFQQLWVSKQEYRESGKSIIAKKCP